MMSFWDISTYSAPAIAAVRIAIIVLPVPGGPHIRMFRCGDRSVPVNSCGLLIGTMMFDMIVSLVSIIPTMSPQPSLETRFPREWTTTIAATGGK